MSLRVRGEKMTLVFEVSSNIAMFRKGYTTTSMVSYPFLTPTAAAGVIGAITGIDNGANEQADSAQFWEEMQGTRIGISIGAPLSWFTTAVNLLKFKNRNGDMREHIQPKHQFVKNPLYRVYVNGGKIYDRLKTRLEQGECVYTPYLGVAYAVADVKFIGEISEVEIEDTPVEVNSLIPVFEGMSIDISRSTSVFREVVPFELNSQRNFVKSVPVLYSGKGSKEPIVIREKGKLDISRVGEENVAWFDRW